MGGTGERSELRLLENCTTLRVPVLRTRLCGAGTTFYEENLVLSVLPSLSMLKFEAYQRVRERWRRYESTWYTFISNVLLQLCHLRF